MRCGPFLHDSEERIYIYFGRHYLSSCEKVLKSDRLSTGIEAFPACLNFSLKVKDYKTALDMLSRMIKIYVALSQTYRVHQCYLSQVVIQLKRNDAVGARNAFEASLNDKGKTFISGSP